MATKYSSYTDSYKGLSPNYGIPQQFNLFAHINGIIVWRPFKEQDIFDRKKDFKEVIAATQYVETLMRFMAMDVSTKNYQFNTKDIRLGATFKYPKITMPVNFHDGEACDKGINKFIVNSSIRVPDLREHISVAHSKEVDSYHVDRQVQAYISKLGREGLTMLRSLDNAIIVQAASTGQKTSDIVETIRQEFDFKESNWYPSSKAFEKAYNYLKDQENIIYKGIMLNADQQDIFALEKLKWPMYLKGNDLVNLFSYFERFEDSLTEEDVNTLCEIVEKSNGAVLTQRMYQYIEKVQNFLIARKV